MTGPVKWDEFGLWLTKADVARLYGRSEGAIERLVRLGRDIPPPAFTHPMRWSREVLRRHWEGESPALMHAKKRRSA